MTGDRAQACRACGEIVQARDLGAGERCAGCVADPPARPRAPWERPTEQERALARVFFAEMRARFGG